MKNVIEILILAFCCFISCSEPNGFEILEKAKKNYTQNNLDEALVLFNKARQSDFGTCGFSYLEAFSEIDYFKIQIYLKQKEYNMLKTKN